MEANKEAASAAARSLDARAEVRESEQERERERERARERKRERAGALEKDNERASERDRQTWREGARDEEARAEVLEQLSYMWSFKPQRFRTEYQDVTCDRSIKTILVQILCCCRVPGGVFS